MARYDTDPTDEGGNWIDAPRARTPGRAASRPAADLAGEPPYLRRELADRGLRGLPGEPRGTSLGEDLHLLHGHPFWPSRELPRPDYTGRGPRGWRRSDQRILEDVCETLTRHPEIDASDIEVRVEEGEVTLSGTTDDRYTKRLAEHVAELISGVHDVHNRITVRRTR